MARITDQIKSRTAFGQQFSEVLDRTEALRGISAEISPRPVESDDEGFVAETIKSFTDPIIGAAKATIQAPGALLESSDLTEEATEIKLELDSLLKQKGFMADEEFRSQLGILKARNENLGSKVDVFDEALPEQEQVARDFGASMLIATSFGAGKIVAGVAGKTVIQAFPKLSRIARGGIAGSSLFAADAVQEGKNFQDTLGEAGIGFVIGGAGDLVAPVLFKGASRAIRVGVKGITFPARVAIRKTSEKFPILKALKPTIQRIAQDFGDDGKLIADKFVTATKEAQGQIGEFLASFGETGLMKMPRLFKRVKGAALLTDDEAWRGAGSVLNVMEGRVKPNSLKVSSRVRTAYNSADGARTWVESAARSAVNEFRGIKKYFPHLVPSVNKVRSKAGEPIIGKEGSLRWRAIVNATDNLNEFKTYELAAESLDGWIAWVDSGGRGKTESIEKFIDWVMRSNKMTSRKEARNLAQRMLPRVKETRRVRRVGSLEMGRDINFPFWEPDPRQALPLYVSEAVSRVKQLQAFGPKDKALNQYIANVRNQKGEDAAKSLDHLVRVLQGTAGERSGDVIAGVDVTPVLRGFRELNSMLLSFAQIVNLGQTPTNVLLGSDAASLWHGWRSAFKDKGIVDALRSGAIIERVMNDSLYYNTGNLGLSKNVIKYTGFGWTELFNRVTATNAGMKYFQRQAERLAADPKNKILQQRVAELGGDVAKIARRKAGKVTEAEVLKAGNIFAARTQFLSDPASLPAFASSEWGKTVFQFKNFAYNQTLFLKDEFKKNPLRTALILGTVFPMTGEVVLDLRSLVTQEKRPTKALDRYLWNMTSAGSYGILSDMFNSLEHRKTLEAFAGPSIAGGAKLFESVFADITAAVTGRPVDEVAKFLLRRTGVGRIPVNVFWPPNREGKSSLESLGYKFK